MFLYQLHYRHYHLPTSLGSFFSFNHLTLVMWSDKQHRGEPQKNLEQNFLSNRHSINSRGVNDLLVQIKLIILISSTIRV